MDNLAMADRIFKETLVLKESHITFEAMKHFNASYHYYHIPKRKR